MSVSPHLWRVIFSGLSLVLLLSEGQILDPCFSITFYNISPFDSSRYCATSPQFIGVFLVNFISIVIFPKLILPFVFSSDQQSESSKQKAE